MTPTQLRTVADFLDFHFCPNTGRVIHSHKTDDKAFCRCGKPNPAIPGETPHAHLKARMAPATVEQFVDQELWGNVMERTGVRFES